MRVMISPIDPSTPDLLVGIVGVSFVVAVVAIIGSRLWLDWRERHSK